MIRRKHNRQKQISRRLRHRYSRRRQRNRWPKHRHRGKDWRVNNPRTSTADGNEGADKPGTNIADRDKRLNNLGIGIGIADKIADNPGIGTTDINIDKGVENIGRGTIDADRTDNSGISVDKKVDKLAAASNKARIFLFSLSKARFILNSFSELETVFASLFISSLFLMTLLKQKVLSSQYSMPKMWISNLNKALLIMTFVLIPSKFFTRYFQSWIVSCIHLLLIMLD